MKRHNKARGNKNSWSETTPPVSKVTKPIKRAKFWCTQLIRYNGGSAKSQRIQVIVTEEQAKKLEALAAEGKKLFYEKVDMETHEISLVKDNHAWYAQEYFTDQTLTGFITAMDKILLQTEESCKST